MTPERLEELRQIAGGINGTKSNWMDELIEYIDRLRAENYLLCDELKRVNERLSTKLAGKQQRANPRSVIGSFATLRDAPAITLDHARSTPNIKDTHE